MRMQVMYFAIKVNNYEQEYQEKSFVWGDSRKQNTGV